MKGKTGKILLSVIIILITASVFIFVVPLFSENDGIDRSIGKAQPLDPKSIVTDEKTGLYYVKDQLIVSFTSNADRKSIESIISSVNGEIVGYITDFNIFQVNIKSSVTIEDLNKIKNDVLKKNPLVTSVSLNTVSQINYDTKTPVDPWEEGYKDGDDIWNEEDPNGSNWGFEAVKAPSAWQYNDKISKVMIGIVDGGFYINHPELKIDKSNAAGVEGSYLLPGKDYNKNNTEDWNKHGTYVAGIIGAIPGNNIGVTGMIKNRDFVVFRTDGQGITSFRAQIGFLYCIKKGARIINFSMGNSINSEKLKLIKEGALKVEDDEYIKDYISSYTNFFKQLKEHKYDFLIVQAAGNDGIDERWSTISMIADPDIRTSIIIVGGATNLTISGKHAGYARYEDGIFSSSNYGSGIDVVAPGQDVYGIWKDDFDSKDPSKEIMYTYKSGTSAAAPFVTGLAGLVQGANPKLSCKEIKQIIVDTTQDGFYYKGIR